MWYFVFKFKFQSSWFPTFQLTYWNQVTHVSMYTCNLTIIGSDNGLSPDRRQASTWTNAEISLIVPVETNCSDFFYSKSVHFHSTEMHLKTSSVKWRPFCLRLNVLTISHCQFDNSWGSNRQQAIVIWTNVGLVNLPICMCHWPRRFGSLTYICWNTLECMLLLLQILQQTSKLMRCGISPQPKVCL